MFDDRPKFRVFGTYSGQAFPDTLLDGLTTRLQEGPPEHWARVEVYVNTQRMQRRLAELFLQGPARLMPRFTLVTDLAHDPLLTDLPMPVPTLKRRLEIAQLVRLLIQRVEGLAPASAIFDLANSLASLMDEMQGEGIAPAVIEGLDISDFSGHWERALQFIAIVQRYFEGGEAPDQEARQRASVLALTLRWQENPPDHPILLAGSTGSRGTTFHLMKAVAGLPQGAVILPGFDFDMPCPGLGRAVRSENQRRPSTISIFAPAECLGSYAGSSHPLDRSGTAGGGSQSVGILGFAPSASDPSLAAGGAISDRA